MRQVKKNSKMFLGHNIIGEVNKELICYVCKLQSLGQPITLFKKLNNKLIKRKRIIKKKLLIQMKAASVYIKILDFQSGKKSHVIFTRYTL